MVTMTHVQHPQEQSPERAECPQGEEGRPGHPLGTSDNVETGAFGISKLRFKEIKQNVYKVEQVAWLGGSVVWSVTPCAKRLWVRFSIKALT